MGRFYRTMVLIGMFIPALAQAQKMDCEQTIAYATEEFNAGHFYSIPAILNECLTNFSRDQRQRAFLLLTQTYLLLDDPIGAQKSYLEVLTANPEFIPDEQLHAIDIVYLSKKFTATPKFSWFVSTGSGVSPVRVIFNNFVAEDKSENYTLRAGYQAAIGGEYSYDDNVKVRAELNYLHTTYKTQSVDYFGIDHKELVDRQSWVGMPLYVTYIDHIGKYRPYGYAGYAFSWMVNDRGSITVNNVEPSDGEQATFSVPSPDLDLLESRNKLNQSLIFGGGVRYKIGLDFVFVEMRYSMGLRNLVNPARLYANYSFDKVSGAWIQSFDPTASYGHVDDYFRLDNLAISVGFVRPLYKPRELKRAKTKSVLRRIKKSK